MGWPTGTPKGTNGVPVPHRSGFGVTTNDRMGFGVFVPYWKGFGVSVPNWNYGVANRDPKRNKRGSQYPIRGFWGPR